ncbi:uncharacterized protein MEPE_02321 [Melanopsichium pennsylvanicum]|uniref:Uncharacterized protein n=1 Tax=Melanopsichium pennsylvanicum TaxID=63383 RepID=A0AAJ4XJP8_9BASI|nr:uncharacterized protein MEPE_02321 [Melanopsichium pennsylvanicum]
MSLARYNLLIDLNGTCHIADNPTPGAVQAIEKLRAAQQRQPNRIDIRFCSNTSKESSHSLLSRLRRVGFGPDLVSSRDVFTSLDAAHRYVSCRQLRPLLLLSPSAQSVFKDDKHLASTCFFACADIDPENLDSDDNHRLRSRNAVVIGLCPVAAFGRTGEYGADEQVALIATLRALYHRSSEGAALLMGPGAFVAALEAASLCCASSTTVCGKPSQALLQECISGMVSANQVISDYTNIIIGDDSDADLGKGTLHNLVYVGC